ncbi:MAG: peptidoglycan DD-metalloendopeptidase family protein [candidate division Zixibacteria bacterium]|nr:peptidoglycan DD-metalloendopeptidase family protein [candidate division Zixibacteria bacterium]
MKRTGLMCGIMWVLLAAPAFAGDDASHLQDNRRELEDIKSQLKETKHKVDSLKNVEKRLRKTVDRYGDRVSRNRQVVDKLEKQLQAVRDEISSNSTSLASTEDRLRRKKEGYKKVLVDYYRNRRPAADPEWWDYDRFVSQVRLVHYLAALTGGSTREIGQTQTSLRLLSREVDSLKKADAGLSHLRKEKKSKIKLDLALKEKEETSLGNVRRQTGLLQDRLASLSEAARQMEDIIARLEKAQKAKTGEKKPARFEGGAFTQWRGHMTPPIEGRIISSFGWKTNEKTKLKSFSPGIDIRPASGTRAVTACAPGKVAYVGNLRGYENFVIVQHDDGYYTTYAGLSQVTVETDDLVQSGQRLGVCGTGTVRFELRQGREHLDPVEWLDIDGL